MKTITINDSALSVLSISEARELGLVDWSTENECDYVGDIRGYATGWNVEVTNSRGEVGFCSCEFVHEVEELVDEETLFHYSWCNLVPTGRVIFRGYYITGWDEEEREECFLDASSKVLNML